ncbi:MAG: hypothetical protein ACLFWD_03075 [Anaerolineales bacterium]
MQQDLLSRRRSTQNPLEDTAESLLSRDHRGARLRLILLLLGIGTYWLFVAFLADFPRVIPESWLLDLVFPVNIVLDLVTSLFAPRVLVHIVPILAALWLGFRLASHYLTDLFELESPAIAEQYLRGAVFGLGYDALHVSQAEVDRLNRHSPLLRIGGPGYLQVHLGYAVVMETAPGKPRVYGPDQRRFIQGFERLRDVIDLRDQLRELAEVQAVTADGIEVLARDVQMMFRVYGGGHERSLAAPYPYTEGAIRRLVYGRPVTDSGMTNWTEGLEQLAISEIRSFVGGLTLESFLALQPAAEASSADSERQNRSSFHIPRRKLTERFHTQEARQRLRDRGLELDWVGVGTWEIGGAEQASSISIGKSIVGAWQNLQRSRLLQSPSYLERQRARGHAEGIRRPLEGWIGLWESRDFDGRHRCWALLKHIREQLDHITEHQSEPTLGTKQALDHLDHLTQSRRLGGP